MGLADDFAQDLLESVNNVKPEIRNPKPEIGNTEPEKLPPVFNFRSCLLKILGMGAFLLVSLQSGFNVKHKTQPRNVQRASTSNVM